MTHQDSSQAPYVDPAVTPPDAPVSTAPERPAKPAATGSVIREVVETLLLAALIFFAVRLVVLNFRVDGESMIPNLHDREMLLVNRNSYKSIDLNALPGGNKDEGENRFYPFSPPERGDIIVFNPPNGSKKPYIKRVIGLPGEEVTFKGGDVYINGQRLDEPYIVEATRCGGNDQCDLTVQPDTVFVLGDNRNNSSDSRVFGLVPVGNIIGKAWFSYWPPSDMGLVPHYNYPDLPDSPVALDQSAQPAGLPAASPAASPERERDKPRKERQKRDRQAEATPAPGA